MLKYFKHTLENIDGVGIIPTLSLILFFSFFILLLYYVYKTDKGYIREVERLPLDDDNQ